MPSMTLTYHDTRGLAADEHPAFTDVVVKGIAPGGGLYVPDSLPTLTLDEIARPRRPALLAASRRDLRAVRRRPVPPNTSPRSCSRPTATSGTTSASRRWSRSRPDIHVLELWHGPTQAFKDMALQCMPLFFSAAVETQAAARRARPTTTSCSSRRAATPAKPRSRDSPTARTPRSSSSTPPTASRTSSASRWSPSAATTWPCSACGATSTTARAPSRPRSLTRRSTTSCTRRHGSAPLLGELDQLGPPAAADRLLRQRVRGHGAQRRREGRRPRWTCACPPATSATSSARTTRSRWACRSAG